MKFLKFKIHRIDGMWLTMESRTRVSSPLIKFHLFHKVLQDTNRVEAISEGSTYGNQDCSESIPREI